MSEYTKIIREAEARAWAHYQKLEAEMKQAQESWHTLNTCRRQCEAEDAGKEAASEAEEAQTR